MKKQHPNFYRILLLLCFLALLPAGCRSVDDSSGTSVATIQVTPSDTTLETGDVLQLAAALVFTNASTTDCSSDATWSSSETAVATFSSTANGLLSAIAAGTTTITVTCSGKSRAYSMTVTGAATLQSIEIYPNNTTIAESTPQIVLATGVYSDKSTADLTDQVNWSSSDTANIDMERSNGSNSVQATAASVAADGFANITASYGSVSGTTRINVTNGATVSDIYVVTPVSALGTGERIYLKATGLMSNDTVQDVTDWTTWGTPTGSSFITTSNVDKGLVEGIAAGSATIRAAGGGATPHDASITVGSEELVAIEIYPPKLTMDVSTAEQFVAVGIFDNNTAVDLTRLVTWQSSDSSLMTVNTSHRYNPRASALAEGTVYLSARLPNSSVGGNAIITIEDKTLSSIQVTPSDPQYPANLDIQFEATGLFSDGSTQDLTDSVVWSSSDTAVLKTNNVFRYRGKTRTVATGSATLTASLGSISGTSAVTVSSASFSSIQVTPAGKSLPEGASLQMTATALFDDNTSYDLTEYAAWKSSNNALLMVNSEEKKGTAEAPGGVAGPITITASFPGADGSDLPVPGTQQGTVAISTTAATLSSIEVTPTNSLCLTDLSKQFKATAIYSDFTEVDATQFVVWKSSDTTVATALNAPGHQGRFQCNSSGSSTVTAAFESTSGTTSLFVADQ